jgi:hypothetical protein
MATASTGVQLLITSFVTSRRGKKLLLRKIDSSPGLVDPGIQPASARPCHGRKGQPSFILSHELPLDQAPEGYRNFDSREDGWTRVVLHPVKS